VPPTDSDPTRDRSRRRVLGLVLIAVGLLGATGAEGFERYAVQTWGTGDADRSIDAAATQLDGEIMSSDGLADGWLISYEYYYGQTLEVGYQRIPADKGQRLAFGDRVKIEAIPAPAFTEDEGVAFQGRSRLLGTRRQPRAWIARSVRDTRWPRLGISVLVGLAGLWLAFRPRGR
jgi:hypothetical protein